MSSYQQQQQQTVTKEYYVKVPKTKKRFHALKFHTTNEADLTWTKPELQREANQFSIRSEWENLPKFGVGSEFNRENKEIARRKKFGWGVKNQSIDDLPWLLTLKGSEKEKDKIFKGKKSISDNSSYYVFIHNTDGGFDAHPIEDWYSFMPHKTYKTLNIDEAEEEFSKRHKILNKYAIMANKRKTEDGGEGGEDGDNKKGSRRGKSSASGGDGPSGSGGSGRKGFSLMGDGEEWGDEDAGHGGSGRGGDGDLSDDSLEERQEEESEKKKKEKRNKKKKRGDDEEDDMQLNEESDDGDEDGKEQDYDDDDIQTDDDDEELNDPNKIAEEEIGIDQEEAIISLQRDIEELEDGENADIEEDDEDGEKLTAEGKEYKKLMKMEESYKATTKVEDDLSKDSAKKSSGNDSFGTSTDSEIEDPDNDPTVVSLLDRKKTSQVTTFAGLIPQTEGGQATSTQKRKATDDISLQITKRSMTTTALPSDFDDGSSSSLSATTSASAAKGTSTKSTHLKTSQSLTTTSLLPYEDEVRKYLQRKPMTTKEILLKLKKRSTVSKEKLYENLSAVLKKLTDSKLLKIDEINGVKYLSLAK